MKFSICFSITCNIWQFQCMHENNASIYSCVMIDHAGFGFKNSCRDLFGNNFFNILLRKNSPKYVIVTCFIILLQNDLILFFGKEALSSYNFCYNKTISSSFTCFTSIFGGIFYLPSFSSFSTIYFHHSCISSH